MSQDDVLTVRSDVPAGTVTQVLTGPSIYSILAAMNTKATHRGNCQVCGNQQHVMGAVLAKHGYTVTFGFFNGTCSGSGRKPVQTQRTLTDLTVDSLVKFAAEQEQFAANLKAGKVHPQKIHIGEKFNGTTCRYEAQYIAFTDGRPDEQARAVELAIAKAKSDARGACSHAAGLKRMADELHGTELVAIVDKPKAAPAPKATVDVQTAKITGTFASKADRKAELDRISRMFEKTYGRIRELYLATPVRTAQQTDVYYGCHYPHEFTAKRRAAVLAAFPEAANIVTELDMLVSAHKAVKAAP